MSNPYYRQHALDCGINLTAKLVMPVMECAGFLNMNEIKHPVTLEVICPSGIIFDVDSINLLVDAGLDYVIVYHKPIYSVA